MSKEYLEALERLKTAPSFMGGTAEYQFCTKSETLLMQDYETVKQALKRLESIDNADSSEALECLEALEQDIKDRTILAEDRQLKLCAIIKQVLLKAQEPKQCLKWEDLEFKKEEQTMKVLLNGEEYKLSYFTDGITEYVDLLAGNGKYQMGRYVDCYPTDVKFFNDLHLEEILKEDKSE